VPDQTNKVSLAQAVPLIIPASSCALVVRTSAQTKRLRTSSRTRAVRSLCNPRLFARFNAERLYIYYAQQDIVPTNLCSLYVLKVIRLDLLRAY